MECFCQLTSPAETVVGDTLTLPKRMASWRRGGHAKEQGGSGSNDRECAHVVYNVEEVETDGEICPRYIARLNTKTVRPLKPDTGAENL